MHWYAFQVRPQKERAASEVFRGHGLVPYVPMRERMCLINRHRKVRAPRQFPILPGVVFVGMDDPLSPELLWRLVRCRDPERQFVDQAKPDGVSDRTWQWLNTRAALEEVSPILALISSAGATEIRHDHIMRMVEANGDVEAEVLRRVEKRFEVGELVTMGPQTLWPGQQSVIVEISGRKAKLMAQMLGGEVPVTLSVDDLEACA